MRRERKIIRLREYDYRQNGVYAVTICVHERRLAFGRIENGVMRLNPFGVIVRECWLAIPQHFPPVELDEFELMPNHFHGILFIDGEAPPMPEEEDRLRQFGQPQPGSLGTMVGSFKSTVSREIGRRRGCKTKVWQRGFYDHIIRNDRDLTHQRQYIRDNIAKWADDEYNSRDGDESNSRGS